MAVPSTSARYSITQDGSWQRLRASHVNFQFDVPPIAVAAYQKHHGFPDLKGATWNAHADRVERRLGTLLADCAAAFARAFCETIMQGLTGETKEKFASSLAELSTIWWVSRVGCYDRPPGTEEPYFANPLPAGPRLSFPEAALIYGMRELRARYPDLNDAEREKLLGWVLQWLGDALSNELAEQQNELAGIRARLNNQKASTSRPTRPTGPKYKGVASRRTKSRRGHDVRTCGPVAPAAGAQERYDGL